MISIFIYDTTTTTTTTSTTTTTTTTTIIIITNTSTIVYPSGALVKGTWVTYRDSNWRF